MRPGGRNDAALAKWKVEEQETCGVGAWNVFRIKGK